MISTTRSCRYRLLALAACAVVAPMAMAQDLQNPRDRANQICATYGQGFVAGPGPGHCVKVQERLRVEPHARRAALEDPGTGFSSFQDAPMRDRLRLNGGFGSAAAR
jgi:hypothetical protein